MYTISYVFESSCVRCFPDTWPFGGPGPVNRSNQPGPDRYCHIYAENLILVKFVSDLYNVGGFKNSGLTLELRVPVGIGRSGALRGIILS